MNVDNIKPGRNSGPFIRSGTDLYTVDKGLQWFINIMRFLMVVGTFIYIAVCIHNTPIKHTYTEPAGAPGTLMTDRYNLNWWMLSLSAMLHILIPFITLFMTTFRNSFGCNALWSILYLLLFALLIFILVIFGVQYGECNDPTQPGNICNDFQWKCVYVSPCVPAVVASDLEPNPPFLMLYWTNVVLAALYFFYIAIIIFYWLSSPPRIGGIEKRDDNLVTPDDEEPARVSAPVQYVLNTRRSPTHGFKNDKARERFVLK